MDSKFKKKIKLKKINRLGIYKIMYFILLNVEVSIVEVYYIITYRMNSWLYITIIQLTVKKLSFYDL